MLPAAISQKEKQLVKYTGNLYIYLPYTTQTTTVQLASSSLESYTKTKPVSLFDATITYGPCNYIAPFSVGEMVIQGKNNSPMLVASRLERATLLLRRPLMLSSRELLLRGLSQGRNHSSFIGLRNPTFKFKRGNHEQWCWQYIFKKGGGEQFSDLHLIVVYNWLGNYEPKYSVNTRNYYILLSGMSSSVRTQECQVSRTLRLFFLLLPRMFTTEMTLATSPPAT